MCRVIAIANQKGGVAKTTTTISLGVGLAQAGKRVLLIDADPQGHLTMGLGFSKNLRVTLKSMMENTIMGIESDPREAILHHVEGVDVIPSNKLLSGMDMSLLTIEDREKVLKEYLVLLEADYDYIDSQGSEGGGQDDEDHRAFKEADDGEGNEGDAEASRYPVYLPAEGDLHLFE